MCVVRFDLVLCLEEAVDLVTISAKAKRLSVNYSIAPDVPAVVLGDAARIRQILANLLSNAIKFTSTGGVYVQVELANSSMAGPDAAVSLPELPSATACRLLLSITDTGIGIPSDRFDRLFKSFSQIDVATTRTYGGTGLGLAISKKLAEAMNGQPKRKRGSGRGTRSTGMDCR